MLEKSASTKVLLFDQDGYYWLGLRTSVHRLWTISHYLRRRRFGSFNFTRMADCVSLWYKTRTRFKYLRSRVAFMPWPNARSKKNDPFATSSIRWNRPSRFLIRIQLIKGPCCRRSHTRIPHIVSCLALVSRIWEAPALVMRCT